MPQPFDYTLNGADPVASLQAGMNFAQNRQMNEQSMQLAQSDEARQQEAFNMQKEAAAQQQRDQAAAMEAQMAMNAAFGVLAQKFADGTAAYEDVAALSTQFPDMADSLSKTWDGLASERKAKDVAELQKGILALKAGRPDLAIQMLKDREAAARNANDIKEADITKAMIASIEADPNAGLTSLGLLLGVADPEAAKVVLGEAPSISSTPQSYANGTTVSMLSDGSKRVTDAAGNLLSGQDALDAVQAGIESEAKLRGGNAGAAEAGKLGAKIDQGDEAAAADARGKVVGEAQGEAIVNEGKVTDSAQRFIDLIEQVEKDPALPSVLGNVQGRLPAGIPLITGGQAGADISIKMDQLTGQAFLEAYNGIRGAGAITDAEGKAATAAEQRLNTAQSEGAYKAALAEAKKLLRDRMAKAKGKASSARSVSGAGDQGSQGSAFDPAEIDSLMQGP